MEKFRKQIFDDLFAYLENAPEVKRDNPQSYINGEGKTVSFETYPLYDKAIHSFITEMYDKHAIRMDYLKNGIEPLKKLRVKQCAQMTLQEIQLLLTYYIRGERFCTGLVADIIQNGKLLDCARRLYELLNKDDLLV